MQCWKTVVCLWKCSILQPELFPRLCSTGLIAESNGQFPAISDLAREVRYRYFDQPLFDQARKQVYDKVEEQLAYLAANPDVDDRRRARSRVRRMSSASRRFSFQSLLRRAWQCRKSCWRPSCGGITAFAICEISAHSRKTATAMQLREYEHEGRQIHVFATHSDYAVSQSLTAMSALWQILPQITTWSWISCLEAQVRSPTPTSPSSNVSALLNATDFPRPIRRIVVEVASPLHSHGVVGMQHFTYRSGQGGFEEEKLYRGIHPMMAKRLHLWRLNNFNVERLPSIEDVYLLRAVAKENPKDERLFAVAEVRDVTPAAISPAVSSRCHIGTHAVRSGCRYP